MVEVIEATEDDQAFVHSIVTEYFSSLRVISRGVMHDCGELPGFVAWLGDTRVGLAQYNVIGDELEVITLISTQSGLGVGRSLIEAVEHFAINQDLARCWLITTNNNHNAINFYKHIDWRLKAVHEDAVNELSRKLKPEIPLFDDHGVLIKDEFEFEKEIRTAE